MINLSVTKQLMTDFVNDVYDALEGQFPRFLVEEWKDKVTYCRAYAEGYRNEEATDIIKVWNATNNAETGKDLSLSQYVDSIVLEAREYVKMRQLLANIYKTSLREVGITMATDPTNVPEVLFEIISNVQKSLKVLANGDAELEQQLQGLLFEMSEKLEEVITDGP